jgi:hypothetical protein
VTVSAQTDPDFAFAGLDRPAVPAAKSVEAAALESPGRPCRIGAVVCRTERLPVRHSSSVTGLAWVRLVTVGLLAG